MLTSGKLCFVLKSSNSFADRESQFNLVNNIILQKDEVMTTTYESSIPVLVKNVVYGICGGFVAAIIVNWFLSITLAIIIGTILGALIIYSQVGLIPSARSRVGGSAAF